MEVQQEGSCNLHKTMLPKAGARSLNPLTVYLSTLYFTNWGKSFFLHTVYAPNDNMTQKDSEMNDIFQTVFKDYVYDDNDYIWYVVPKMHLSLTDTWDQITPILEKM